MKKLSGREKNILIITLVLVGVFGAINGVYRPVVQKLALLDIQIEAKQNKILKYRKELRDANLVKQDTAVVVAQFKQEGSDEEVLSGMISEVEKLAKGMDLSISDLKPSTAKKGQFIQFFRISLSLNSSFEDLMKFIYLAQDAEHGFNLDDLRIEKGSRRNSETVRVRLVLAKQFVVEQ
jgi:Tfp pilus assembly protein PilO